MESILILRVVCGDLDVLVFRLESGVAGLESPPALPTGDVYCCFQVLSGVAVPEWIRLFRYVLGWSMYKLLGSSASLF